MSITTLRLLKWGRITTTLVALCLAVAGVGTGWVIASCAVAIVFTVASSAADLAALSTGEEPHLDQAIVPTPGQWIWRWNRATPARRLAIVRGIQAMRLQQDRVEALARDWDLAPPLLPGEALTSLLNALSDDPQPTCFQAVQAGGRLIRVAGTRVPTPDERRAVAALLDATAAAEGGEVR